MNGYLPWYREHLSCVHGHSLPFPSRNHTDITRGGWVVAVGLTETVTKEPSALYVDSQMGGDSHLRKVVQRVHDVLINIEEHIADNSKLKNGHRSGAIYEGYPGSKRRREISSWQACHWAINAATKCRSVQVCLGPLQRITSDECGYSGASSNPRSCPASSIQRLLRSHRVLQGQGYEIGHA